MLLALALLGCKNVDEAPKTIEEMMNYMFVHFEDDDPEQLILLRDHLRTFVGNHVAEAQEGWKVNSLSRADLEAAELSADKELKGILGVAASVPYRSTQAEVIRSITWPKKTQVLTNLETYEVKEDGAYRCDNSATAHDLGDFLEQRCEFYYAKAHQVAQAGLLGKATQDVTFQHRWIVPEDSAPIYIIRVLTPQPTDFTNPIIGVTQQYSIAMVYEAGCETPDEECVGRRVEAFWVDVELLGSNLPEDMAANMAITQMDDAAEEVDDFVANGFRPVD